MVMGVYCPRCGLSLSHVNHVVVRILLSLYDSPKKKLRNVMRTLMPRYNGRNDKRK